MRPRARNGLPRAVLVPLAVLILGAGGLLLANGDGSLGHAGQATPGPTEATAPTPGFSNLDLIPVPTGAGPTKPGATAGPGATPPTTLSPTVTPAEAGIRATRITIAWLGIDLAIVEGDGVDAPIGKAAHYPSSAWPGGGSNIYIYAHAQTGMFLTLWNAKVGDAITLDLVDGTSRTYVVTHVLPKVAWDALEYLSPTPAEQLTLQTSTSYFATAPRFVVIAVPAR